MGCLEEQRRRFDTLDVLTIGFVWGKVQENVFTWALQFTSKS